MYNLALDDIARSSVLAGTRLGRKVYGALILLVEERPMKREPVLLDFSNIEIATASFLRESVIEFRDTVRRRWAYLYPIIANPNDSIVDELELLVTSRNDVLLCCNLDHDGNAVNPYLLGVLEAKQRLTFDLVEKLGEANASDLVAETYGIENVGKTAWNNRLATLTRLGLLMEISIGRRKSYRTVLKES